MTKQEALITQYSAAVERLDEALRMPANPIVRDSAIKRFELAFDLAWKTAKTFLEEEKGERCVSPKECFRAAYRMRIIGYDELWIQMTDWRNEAVHTYSEAFANKLYEKLPETRERFKELLSAVQHT